MTDWNVMIGVGLLVVSVAALVAFAIYGSKHTFSLSNAKVGDIFNFEYEQPYHGEHRRVLAKVIEPVYTLDDLTIKRLNRRSGYRRNDPVFQRTHHLVTCQTADGEIRQFYAERAKNVRRPLFGGVAFKARAASLLF